MYPVPYQNNPISDDVLRMSELPSNSNKIYSRKSWTYTQSIASPFSCT